MRCSFVHTGPGLVVVAAWLVLACGATATPGSSLLPTSTPSDSLKKTLAVLYFDNYTGEARYDPLGKGMASMMISDLSSVDLLQLVEREHLESLIRELELQQSRFFDPETALQIGQFVGAEYVVSGSITAASPEIRLDTRVIQVETTNIVKTANVSGKNDEFFQLQSRLADALIEGLDLALSPEARERLQAQQEANRIDDVETALAYSEALDRYDQADYVGALERMNEVRKRAPASQVVSLTYQMMQEKAEEAAKDTAKDKLNRWIRKKTKGD